MKRKCDIKYSRKGYIKACLELLLGEKLKIRSHNFMSNWIVANCGNYLPKGMPWNAAIDPKIEFVETVTGGKNSVTSINSNRGNSSRPNGVQIRNLNARKSKSLTKPLPKFQVFQMIVKALEDKMKEKTGRGQI